MSKKSSKGRKNGGNRISMAKQQQIIVAIGEAYRRLDSLSGHLLWCMRKLEHPAVMEAIAAEEAKATGLVTPPNAGEIVLTDGPR